MKSCHLGQKVQQGNEYKTFQGKLMIIQINYDDSKLFETDKENVRKVMFEKGTRPGAKVKGPIYNQDRFWIVLDEERKRHRQKWTHEGIMYKLHISDFLVTENKRGRAKLSNECS